MKATTMMLLGSLATLSSLGSAGCTCSASHTRGAGSDGGVADGGSLDGADRRLDGEAPDAGGPEAAAPDTGPAPCAIACSTDPIASGYAREVFPGMGDRVDIVAAVALPDGSLHALLAPGPNELGWTGRQWILVSRAPGQPRFAGGTEERVWPPLGPGPLERTGEGLDAALLRQVGSSIEATVLFTVREGPGILPIEVHVARIAWTPEGELMDARDLGRILTLPDPSISGATVFELPSRDVIAALEHAGVVEGVRITAGRIVEHLSLGDSGAELAGAHPISGAAVDDAQWVFAGGGRAWNGARTPFASAVTSGEPAWRATLPGGDHDPPPHVAISGGGAIAVQWHQSPEDIDDATLTATRLLDSGLGETWTVGTPRLPMPLDAHVGGNPGGAFAVWSVRAPDVLDDSLIYLALLDATPACGATEAVLAARLPGGAVAPAIRGALVGDDVVMLGLPVGPSGHPELSALRIHCEVE